MAMERFEIARPLDLQIAVLRCARSALLQGATDLERSVIATIVSELGSNVLKYAGAGSLEIRRHRRGTLPEIEIVAVDAGPGIADVELVLQDHYSSGGTLGLGLPGVRRMADAFEVGATEGGGTTVRVRKALATAHWRDRPAAKRVERSGAAGDGWSAAATVRPRRGHAAGGDAAAVIDRGDRVLLAIIDVTGHGSAASLLARGLVDTLHERFAAGAAGDVALLLQALHEACMGTVGAAAGLAMLDLRERRLRYLAVGNVRAGVVGEARFNGVSRDGLLGRRWPTPFVQSTELRRGDMVLLWTDGLPESLARTLVATPDGRALAEEPEVSLVADGLVEAYGRRHDDAACLVARWQP